MNKKERKANAMLEEARKVLAYREKNTSKAHQFIPSHSVRPKISKQEIVALPVDLTEYKVKYDEIEIIKVKKGNYRVLATLHGQTKELNKRFKSITKAEEWRVVHLIR